jgi:hypothetical protein
VEDEVAQLRQEVEELREEIGHRSDAQGDRVDFTNLITTLEMQEADPTESMQSRANRSVASGTTWRFSRSTGSGPR